MDDTSILTCLLKTSVPNETIMQWYALIPGGIKIVSYFQQKLRDRFDLNTMASSIADEIQGDYIVFLQAVYDPEKAFDESDQGLFQLFSSFPQYVTRHFKIRCLQDVERIFNKIPGKIVHLVIMAHGETDGSGIILDDNYRIKLHTEEFDELVEILKAKLTSRAKIFLHSCSTGHGGYEQNFAQMLAVFLPQHIIYGATDQIHRGDVMINQQLILQKDGSGYINYQIDNEKVIAQGRAPYSIREYYFDI